MNRLVLGAGINDSDYPVTKYKREAGRHIQTWICPFYKAWRGILYRCYSKSLHNRHPSYADCKIDEDWLTFSKFKKWMLSEDWKGKHLDKDILEPGNKTYGPGKCVFIPQELNKFLTSRGNASGDYPTGVCMHKSTGKYQANCRNPFSGKIEYLGLFASLEEAHEEWRKRKHELSCRYADIQTDQRIAIALRKRFSKPFELNVHEAGD